MSSFAVVNYCLGAQEPIDLSERVLTMGHTRGYDEQFPNERLLRTTLGAGCQRAA